MDKNNNMILIAIVAIVAIVGMVGLLMNANGSAPSAVGADENVGGLAVSKTVSR